MIETDPTHPKPTAAWRSTQAKGMAGRVAIDHSLAFHRLQEARQELHLARLPSSAPSPRERERLIAYCEANLASAEQWMARASEPQQDVPP